jgi:hypothetical protein
MSLPLENLDTFKRPLPIGRQSVLMACSAAKRPDAGLMPACNRYDGPIWRTWRAWHRAKPAALWPQTIILSASFGIMPADRPIPDYDTRLGPAKAAAIAGEAAQLDQLAQLTAGAAGIYLCGGRLYRETAALMLARIGFTGRIVAAPAGAGIGTQRAYLRAWLDAAGEG